MNKLPSPAYAGEGSWCLYESHFFRCSHADDAQTDLEHAARRVGQLQAGVAHEGLCVLDAADIVEAVETARPAPSHSG